MPRRRNTPCFPSFPAFEFYKEVFSLSLQTGEMLIASSEVIAYRSQMIQKAMSGELPWTHPEFSQLWSEKILATMQACIALNRNMGKGLFYTPHNVEENTRRLMQAMLAAGRPYHTKTRANAKRLRKKKQ